MFWRSVPWGNQPCLGQTIHPCNSASLFATWAQEIKRKHLKGKFNIFPSSKWSIFLHYVLHLYYSTEAICGHVPYFLCFPEQMRKIILERKEVRKENVFSQDPELFISLLYILMFSMKDGDRRKGINAWPLRASVLLRIFLSKIFFCWNSN